MASTLDDAPPDAPREASREAGRRGWSRGRAASIALPLVLLAVAAVSRFTDLGYPDRIYFDETYYANDANQILTRGVEEGFVVHPPVGKYLIALGIRMFGFDSFGWRFSGAVAGTLAVGVCYLAGLRLFRHRGIAALAALLLTVDGLAFTMSRISMLDVFLGLFVLTGFWLLLVDRDHQWAAVAQMEALTGGEADPDRTLPRRPHTYRWLAGIAFGLALATKWSAVLAIAPAGLFVLVSELAWRRRLTGRLLVHPERIVASGIATLVLVPLGVYLVSYAGWFANYEQTRLGVERCVDGACDDLSFGDLAGEWYGEQVAIARFHRDLEAEHSYRSSPATWLFLGRPVAYYYEECDDPASKAADDPCVVEQGSVEEILGIGNPLLWWMAIPAYLVLLAFAVLRRDWRAWAILAFLVLQYLPWLLVARPNFLFYMTPAVPFIALALAYAAWRSLSSQVLRPIVAPGIAVLAVGAFLWFLPVLIGAELAKDGLTGWDARIWFGSWI